MSTNKSIFKSASVIGSATLFSRILGFIRDIVIAKLFGTGVRAEAFVVAFRIPNMLRELIGEGATNAAFVPVFSEYLAKKDRKEFWQLADIMFKVLFVGLSLLTVLGMIFSPWIVRLIAPGFANDPYKLLLTIRLNRIMFGYLVLIGLTAYSMGILHSFKSFLIPAIGPSLLNIALIASAVVASTKLKEPVFGLAVGVLIGGFLQLAIQLPPLLKRGFRLRADMQFFHPGAKRIARLLAPRMLGSAVYQLNIFIDTVCASLVFIVGTGAVAAIYYANRIIQFPLAIFGIAISSAALPTMSDCVARHDFEQLKSTITFSLKSIFLVMVPAAVGLAVLSKPIIHVLFRRGQFDLYSAQITSFALLFYSLGLVFYGSVKIMLASFYSLQDTLTPVKIAGASLLVNAILNIILMFPLKVGGIALASSFSSMVNFFALFFILRKRIGPINEKELCVHLWRVVLAGIIMGLGISLARKYLFLKQPEFIRLSAEIAIGIFIFTASCFVLKIREIGRLFKWLLKIK